MKSETKNSLANKDKYLTEKLNCHDCGCEITRREGVSMTNERRGLNNDWFCRPCANKVTGAVG